MGQQREACSARHIGWAASTACRHTAVAVHVSATQTEAHCSRSPPFRCSQLDDLALRIARHAAPRLCGPAAARRRAFHPRRPGQPGSGVVPVLVAGIRQGQQQIGCKERGGRQGAGGVSQQQLCGTAGVDGGGIPCSWRGGGPRAAGKAALSSPSPQRWGAARRRRPAALGGSPSLSCAAARLATAAMAQTASAKRCGRMAGPREARR